MDPVDSGGEGVRDEAASGSGEAAGPGTGMMVMRALAALGLAIALAASSEAVAWQMESVEPGQGQNIIGGDPSGRGTGSGGSGAGPLIRIEPMQPGGRGGPFDAERRRPTVFDEGRDPFYRPGSGRNCSGEGPGRVCF
jgi:hypothetical protein